jgi:hypothetical protein
LAVVGCPTVLMMCQTPWGGVATYADVLWLNAAGNRVSSSSTQPDEAARGGPNGEDGEATGGGKEPGEEGEDPGNEGEVLPGGEA